jgi:hypothetical protein
MGNKISNAVKENILRQYFEVDDAVIHVDKSTEKGFAYKIVAENLEIKKDLDIIRDSILASGLAASVALAKVGKVHILLPPLKKIREMPTHIVIGDLVLDIELCADVGSEGGDLNKAAKLNRYKSIISDHKLRVEQLSHSADPGPGVKKGYIQRVIADVLGNLKIEVKNIRITFKAPLPERTTGECIQFGASIERVQLKDKKGKKSSSDRSFEIIRAAVFCNLPTKRNVASSPSPKKKRDTYMVRPFDTEVSISSKMSGSTKKIMVDANVSSFNVACTKKQFKLLVFVSNTMLHKLEELTAKSSKSNYLADQPIGEEDKKRYAGFYKTVLENKYELTLAVPVPDKITDEVEKGWIRNEVYGPGSSWTLVDIQNVHASVTLLVKRNLKRSKRKASKPTSFFKRMWSSAKSSGKFKVDNELRQFQNELMALDANEAKLQLDTAEMLTQMSFRLAMKEISVVLAESKKVKFAKFVLKDGVSVMIEKDDKLLRVATKAGQMFCYDQRLSTEETPKGLVIASGRPDSMSKEDKSYFQNWDVFGSQKARSSKSAAAGLLAFKMERKNEITSVSCRSQPLDVVADLDLFRTLTLAFSVPVSEEAKLKAAQAKANAKQIVKTTSAQSDLETVVNSMVLDLKFSSAFIQIPSRIAAGETHDEAAPFLQFCPGSLYITTRKSDSTVSFFVGSSTDTHRSALLELIEGSNSKVTILPDISLEMHVNFETDISVNAKATKDIDVSLSPGTISSVEHIVSALVSDGQGTLSGGAKKSVNRGHAASHPGKPVFSGSLPPSIPIHSTKGTKIDISNLFQKGTYSSLVLVCNLPEFSSEFKCRSADSESYVLFLKPKSKEKTGIFFADIVAVNESGETLPYTFSFYSEPDAAKVEKFHYCNVPTMMAKVVFPRLNFQIFEETSRDVIVGIVLGSKEHHAEVEVIVDTDGVSVDASLEVLQLYIPKSEPPANCEQHFLEVSATNVDVNLKAGQPSQHTLHSSTRLVCLPVDVRDVNGSAACGLSVGIFVPSHLGSHLDLVGNLMSPDTKRAKKRKSLISERDASEDEEEGVDRKAEELKNAENEKKLNREKAQSLLEGSRVKLDASVEINFIASYDPTTLSTKNAVDLQLADGLALEYENIAPPIFTMPICTVVAVQRKRMHFTEEKNQIKLVVAENTTQVGVASENLEQDSLSSFHLALGENDAGVLLALKDELLQKLEPVQSIVETQKGKGHKDISNDAPDSNCSGNYVNQQCLQFSNGFQICLKMVNLRSKKGAGNVSVAHVTTMTSIKCDGLRMFRTDSVSNALERRNVKMNSKLEFSNIEIAIPVNDGNVSLYFDGAVDHLSETISIRSQSARQLTATDMLSVSLASAGVQLEVFDKDRQDIVENFSAMFDIERADRQNRDGDKFSRLFTQELQFSSDLIAACICLDDINVYLDCVKRATLAMELISKANENFSQAVGEVSDPAEPQLPRVENGAHGNNGMEQKSMFKSTYVKKMHIRGMALNVQSCAKTILSARCDSIFGTGDLYMKGRPKEIFIDLHASGIHADVLTSQGNRNTFSPIMEEWAFSIFVQRFREDYIKDGSDYSKGMRVTISSPGPININLGPSIVRTLLQARSHVTSLMGEKGGTANEMFEEQESDQKMRESFSLQANGVVRHLSANDLALQLAASEDAFVKGLKNMGETHKPPIYGEESTGAEELSQREAAVLSLKGGTFDRVANGLGSIVNALQEDVSNVSQVRGNLRSWMAEQGGRFLPDLTVSSNNVVVFVQNFLDESVDITVDLISEGGDKSKNQKYSQVISPAGFTPGDGSQSSCAVEIGRNKHTESVVIAAHAKLQKWSDGQQIDLATYDEKIQGADQKGAFRATVERLNVDENHVEVEHIIITLYSVCWIVNNTPATIQIREADESESSALLEIQPYLPEDMLPDEDVPQYIKRMDHSAFTPLTKQKKTPETDSGTSVENNSGAPVKNKRAMKVQIRTKLSKSYTWSMWSEPFSIETVGTDGQIELKTNDDAKDMKEQWGIFVSATNRSKLVSIAPRYVLINNSTHAFMIRQTRCSQTGESEIFDWEKNAFEPKGEARSMHFVKWTGHLQKSLQVCVAKKTYWSDDLHVDAVRPLGAQYRLLPLPGVGDSLCTFGMQVKHVGSTTIIVFVDAPGSFLCVDQNVEGLTLKMRQKNIVVDILSTKDPNAAAPKPSRSYCGWGNAPQQEEEKPKLQDKDESKDTQLPVGLCPDDQRGWIIMHFDYEGKRPLYLDYDNGSNNHFDIADENGNLLGTINVVKTGMFSINDSLNVRLSAEGAYRVLEFVKPDDDSAAAAKFGQSAQLFGINVDLSSVGISILETSQENDIEEILYVSFFGVGLKYAKSVSGTVTTVLSCTSVQIDNQTPGGNRVVLAPAMQQEPDTIWELDMVGDYAPFLKVALHHFLVHVDIWKYRRAANDIFAAQNAIAKHESKSETEEKVNEIFFARLLHDFSLFIIYEDPYASLSVAMKKQWLEFRENVLKLPLATEKQEYDVSMRPYLSFLTREINMYNQTKQNFFLAVERNTDSYSFNHLELDLPLLDIEIHEEFIFSLAVLLQGIAEDIKQFGISDDKLEMGMVENGFDSPPIVKFDDQLLTLHSCIAKATDENKRIVYFFGNIDFHKVETRLTYIGAVPGSKKRLSNLSSATSFRVFSSMMSIEDLILIFASLSQKDASYTNEDFQNTVGKFYKDQALRRLYKVVLNISVLDTPVRAVAGIGSGVSQLLNTPGRALGALKRGEFIAAGKAICFGVGGVGRSVAGGAAKMGSGLIGGFGFVLKKITGVTAVTRTLFSPATQLLDFSSRKLGTAYDTLVENASKHKRKNTRARLPRYGGYGFVKYCYLDACANSMLQAAKYAKAKNNIKKGSTVPALGIVQDAPYYICGAFLLEQRLLKQIQGGDFVTMEPMVETNAQSILVLTCWHISCIAFVHDQANSSDLMWAIPLRRIIDVSLSPICGPRTNASDSMELAVVYMTNDGDLGETRQRRFVGLNRRGLVYMHAHLKKFSNAYSRRLNEY